MLLFLLHIGQILWITQYDTELGGLLQPWSYLVNTGRVISSQHDAQTEEIKLSDGHIADHEKAVVVLVIGESARKANFQLYGYHRDTNPLLSRQAGLKVYQANACWTMNPATFTALKEMKDGESRYLLQSDVTKEFPYLLLGKPVYLSDNMPTIANAAKAVLYGDYSGLAVNFRENISVEVLREKYATQHAIGVVSWFEFDSKVMDSQRLAALVMSVSG